MRVAGALLAAAVLCCGMAACFPALDFSVPQPKVEGQLTGATSPFPMNGCWSGRPSGFYGVEIASATGEHLRLVQNPDGTTSAILFPAGSPTGVTMKAGCAQAQVSPTNVSVNGVTFLEGTAQLACDEIKGTVQFRCGA